MKNAFLKEIVIKDNNLIKDMIVTSKLSIVESDLRIIFKLSSDNKLTIYAVDETNGIVLKREIMLDYDLYLSTGCADDLYNHYASKKNVTLDELLNNDFIYCMYIDIKSISTND